MGGNQSAPAPPPPTIIDEPYPLVAGADSISLSQAVKCGDCQLQVDTNISVSSVTLKRELGDIQSSQCAKFARDKQLVKDRFMSLADFMYNLQTNQYSRPVSERNEGGRPQQFCEMVYVSEEDAEKIKTIDEVDAKLKGGRIRKVSGSGGFSSGTKARFIPSIPFNMAFAGTKVVAGPNNTRQYEPFKDVFEVKQLVLFHPSPIRVDSVQADAILALNDPSDTSAKGIVLVPLRGTNSTSDSATFLNKLVQTLPSVGTYDEKAGTYPESTVQTGSGWALSKLFTLNNEAGAGGTSEVKNGFFTWTGVSGYEREKKVSGNTIRYTWKPIKGLASPQYFLLDSPLDINLTDLSLITSSLNPTPTTEAIHPVPAQTDLVFHKGSVPPAPDTISGGGCPTGITNFCEGFTTGNLNDQLKASTEFEASCPGAKCDPFLQNANRSQGTLNGAFVIGVLFQMLVVIAMAVGAYIALSMVAGDYDLKLREFAENVGLAIASWIAKRKAAISGLVNAAKGSANLSQGLSGLGEGKLPGGLSGLGEGKLSSGLSGLGEGKLSGLSGKLSGLLKNV